MKNDRVSNLANCTRLFAAFALLVAILASGGLSQALAQDSGDRAINQAQRAVREQIITREGARGQTVLFNSDASSEFKSNTEVLVRGTGTLSNNNDTRNNNARNNDGRSREFSYEAIVNNRYRNNTNNVSGIRYDWRGGWLGNDRSNDRSLDGGFRTQSIYCASDDGRRHTCPINTNGGAVRMVNQKRGSNCVQGRTWGFNNAGIWVDRGCRADFEVSGGRGYGNNGNGNDGRGNSGRDNNAGYGNASRPTGRVIYSGPIMNRHSDKALDVTEQAMQDGANIQQWSYADQPNQNWDVIDLGNNEVAIVSRHSGRALTVQGGRDNNGANIIQRGWNGNPQQRWRLEQTGGDYYKIVSVDNGKCLDVTQQGKENGANVQLWDYANQGNQQWRLKR
ncbi:MAG: RICIN domain-containing protein [Acidobacteriota bacterium]|nr:RICIN domain-containing protein [Acidobacteriota bacterium]